jgi:hypothetical protein
VIPSTAHFIWIGQNFPWLNWAALASAENNGEFASVRLHHTHDLSSAPWWRALERLRVESHRLNPDVELELAAGPRLVDRYRALTAPAAQANVLRIALLLNHGGVYLDLDTVTMRTLAPLRERSSFFCGLESIAFPATLDHSKNPLAWGRALLLTTARDLLRRSRQGVRWFRGIQQLFPAAANNAVLGAEANHPFLRELCQRMLELSPGDSRRRYALGTSLLQHALATTLASDLTQHSPEVFYPLGPEMSEHWFRLDTGATLDQVLAAETRVVHWYASVRTRELAPRIDPDWIRRHRERQLLSALLLRALELPGREGGPVREVREDGR